MQEQTGFLTGLGGVQLFYRVWSPPEPQGSMVLVHGFNEHSGRYTHVAEFFTARGYAVYALDHRGHGRSEGHRCYIDRFDDYLHDLHLLVQKAQAHGIPILVGHSMGGLIAYRYALAHPDTIQALVLSSPFFRNRAQPDPVTKMLAPLMSKLLPRLQIPARIPMEWLTRSTEALAAAKADPLFGSKATPRWFIECTRAGEACHGETDLKMPVLFLQAGDDLMVVPEATREIYERVSQPKKAFKLYPGKYHEIFNDPGYQKVFEDIVTWLQEQELVPTV